jgi:hypothetical protein
MKVKWYWNRLIDWLWFGTITEAVKSIDGGCISEIEYRGRGNKVVGYWAYGNYDQCYPYPRGMNP